MNFPDILVLGATGRIGAVLRHFWPENPRLNTRPDSTLNTLWQARPGRIPDKNAPGERWVEADPLQDPAALNRAAEGCAVILCLAGVVPGRPGAGGGGGGLADNSALAEAAVRAAARTGAAGATVLLASSAAVYGNQQGRLGEDTPLRPITGYGHAKARMEQHALRLGQRLGVAVCCLRIGNIAGLDAILGNWRPGFTLDRFDDGQTPRRSYIGVRTLARVLGDLAGTTARLPAALNIAAPDVTGMGALLDAAGLAWIPRPAPDAAIAEVRLDTRALARITPLAATEADPGRLVAQWQCFAPHMNMDRNAR
jgi:nucleoside-diphosphate-sugar epimerase